MCLVQYRENRPDIRNILLLRETLYDRLSSPIFEDLSLDPAWPDIRKMRQQEEQIIKKYMKSQKTFYLTDFYKVRRAILWNWLLKNPECEASPDDLFNKEVV